MLEKRKHKRLKMEHALELARLNADGTAGRRRRCECGYPEYLARRSRIFVPQETRGRQLL